VRWRKAVKVSRIQPGETAAVFGVGGLGHLALQYARRSAHFAAAAGSSVAGCPLMTKMTIPIF
jgi:D-arabinose 1-dehydrogenase-like Zn-dependent alcohol dehydrogenase